MKLILILTIILTGCSIRYTYTDSRLADELCREGEFKDGWCIKE